MKDPLDQLCKAYYTALSGVLTVYDGMVPDNAGNNYIVIGERSMGQQPDKDTFFSECMVLIDVVCKGQGTGYKTVSNYVNQVLAIVNSDTEMTMTDFKMNSQTIDSINDMNSLEVKEKVFRKLIRVRSLISQK